eukprot:CAMPEP_0195513646 /NCGR_PEP_ID=MMETSP0794_2-20130614/5252_1 /TAXON_ID=515487 /ORGANISM="Stephanopyxis turris, Strain CCMP 815" /LENGTH=402 /DNA_ID=CAMNT_0040641709 /DNA_START=179 /DNA_END=1384 /DNA_ORIENTATION=-
MGEPGGIGLHARHIFDEVESSGPASRPLDYPPPIVHSGVRVNALVVLNPSTNEREEFPGVIHRAPSHTHMPEQAYFPQRQLQEAIYGSVWACLLLRRSRLQPESGADGEAPEIIWEATSSHVAIKMVEWAAVRRLRGRHIEDPIKEVAAMQLLGNGSRHVLGSNEVLQDDHYLYSVMPYCRGGDLFGVVVQHGEDVGEEGAGMPEPMVRYWFRQILKGLHYLQSKGVCHRDLSLENILVDQRDCLIIDMGMCLREPYSSMEDPTAVTDVTQGAIRRLIRPQGVCGKHNYMSPEIFQNVENFDGFAIDLWAAGVILYIMLTGFPPYDQASLVDQRFELIVRGNLMEQLNEWEVLISPQAGDLLQNMMRLDPRHRLTLAQVMAHPWVTNPDVQPPALPEAADGW